MYELVYRPDAIISLPPVLVLTVHAPWTSDLRLMEAMGYHHVTEFNLGGHRGFISDDAGPTNLSLTEIYDGRTVVALNSQGLSAQQLLAVAASLGPRPPPRWPPT